MLGELGHAAEDCAGGCGVDVEEAHGYSLVDVERVPWVSVRVAEVARAAETAREVDGRVSALGVALLAHNHFFEFLSLRAEVYVVEIERRGAHGDCLGCIALRGCGDATRSVGEGELEDAAVVGDGADGAPVDAHGGIGDAGVGERIAHYAAHEHLRRLGREGHGEECRGKQHFGETICAMQGMQNFL